MHGAVHVLVSRVLELNHAARSAPAITLEGRTCWSNLGALGMHPRWCLLSLSRRALHAWRDEAAANGPNRMRARENVRQLKLCIRREEEQRFVAARHAARADLHRVRALVSLVVSTGRAPGLYELGLQQSLLWATRDVAAADVTREEALHREVRLRWEQEGEEMMLDYPRARDFELEDISFGARAAGWRWRLVHLLSRWRAWAARGFLHRREATRLAPRLDERLHRQLTRRWERFRELQHRSPIPLSVVSGLIVEPLKTRWEEPRAGPRGLVPTSTASTRETHLIPRARHAPGVFCLPWHERTIPELSRYPGAAVRAGTRGTRGRATPGRRRGLASGAEQAGRRSSRMRNAKGAARRVAAGAAAGEARGDTRVVPHRRGRADRVGAATQGAGGAETERRHLVWRHRRGTRTAVARRVSAAPHL